jgi:hypothetical protein
MFELLNAIFKLISEIPSIISQAVTGFLLRKFNFPAKPGLNIVVTILVYVLFSIPFTIAIFFLLIYLFFYVGVFLLNWWLSS